MFKPLLSLGSLILIMNAASSLEFKDPTEPPDVDLHIQKTVASDVLRSLNLNEIISNGSEKWAVINNTIVRVGDVISGERVVKIEKNYIKLKGEKGVIELYLINGKPIKELSP